MGFLQGLHGTVAILAICGLLFVDETGVPLPFAPNEVLLLLGGLLVADGSVVPWIYLPAAALSMTAGMITGYFWARTLGQTGLSALAQRVGAARMYDRAQARLANASSLSIGLTRMIPGARPYATLIAGAAAVDLRRFASGAIPALLVWEVIWTFLGVVVGLPVEHLLGRFERLALRGGVLIVLGAIGYFGLRHLDDRVTLQARWSPGWGSHLYGALIEGTCFACIIAGVLAIARRVASLGSYGWIDLVLIGALVFAYLVITEGGLVSWRHTPQ